MNWIDGTFRILGLWCVCVYSRLSIKRATEKGDHLGLANM